MDEAETTIEDPVFGVLKTNGRFLAYGRRYTWRREALGLPPTGGVYWWGTFYSQLFAREIGLSVIAHDTGPDDAQRSLFTQFKERETGLCGHLEQALFLDYGDYCAWARRHGGAREQEGLRVVPEPGAIWQVIVDGSLTIPDQEEEPSVFYLYTVYAGRDAETRAVKFAGWSIVDVAVEDGA